MKKTMRKRSKRVSTKQRVKSEKKVREHNRKLRREKRKNPGKFAKSKKDPGVPNECPFKEQVLQEAEHARQQKAAEKEKRREEAKQKRADMKAKALDEKRARGLEGLVEDAERKNKAHEEAQELTDTLKNQQGVTDRSAKAYYKEFQKVVEVADVVLEVLDARDPLGTRCKEVESLVLGSGKRLVLVMNKADLVPKDNLESWLKNLRAELPSIAFKSSTQSQGQKLGQSKVDMAKVTDSQLQTSKCVGAGTLLSLLGNYCRNKDIKTSVRVGVVGLPNVGKSSLINSLKRTKACHVGSTPGVTKVMQEIQIDSKVKLLDSPGLVLASGLRTDASVALRNAIRVETMDDPVTPVQAILQRCPKQQMMLQYHVADYDDCEEFLALVARGMGKLRKGGVPNIDMAARAVLNDWNGGKIKYFTHPPAGETKETHVSAEVVGEFAKEFSLENLVKMDQEDMDSLPHVLSSETMLVDSSGIVQSVEKLADDEMEADEESSGDDDDGDENVGQLSNRVSVAASKRNAAKKVEEPKFKAEGLAKLKKANKMREKKERKDRRRRDNVAADLSQGLESALGSLTSEKYDFGKDFDM